MSVSAAQAEAFYEEVLRAGQVWAIGDGPAARRPERHGTSVRVGPNWSGPEDVEHNLEARLHG